MESKKKSKKVTSKKPKEKVVKKTNKKVTTKKKKKAFTLIELLSVIIILGILMIIAIPSVTTYINNSRKSAYVDTAKEIVSGARNKVNEGKLDMFSTDTTYYLPASCINTENELKSPYGEFIEAYVGVIFDGRGYNYYWVSTDDAGQGIKEIIPVDKLDIDKIESNVESNQIRNIVNTTQIDGKSKILILNGDCKSWDDERLATAYVGIEGGSSTEIRVSATCEAGKYLPQGAETCSDCPAGSYCTGGTYLFSNNSSDQGKEECAVGSYSATGASVCTACTNGKTTSGVGQTSCNANCSNNIGVNSWKTTVWNNNTVNNVCKVSTCNNVGTGVYTLKNNECVANGTIYYNDFYFSYQTPYIDSNQKYVGSISSRNLNKNNYNKISSDKDTYLYIKLVLEDSIVKDRYVCFGITSKMNISGANIGEYCLRGKPGDEAYQENITILKSIFGNNSSYCTDSGTKYECKNYSVYWSNGKFRIYVTKDGECYVLYDEPKQGIGYPQPYCVTTKINSYCSDYGCLSGDTEVDVYDRKKKRRYRKKLRDVTLDDLILCWNFDKSEFTYVEPLWIKKVETLSRYYLLEFSDGSKLEVVGDHKVFDADRNKFVNAGTDNELKIGSHVYNSNGEIVELVSWKVIEEAMDSYNVITNYHMNMFANGILTSCVLSNIYEIKDMKYVDTSIERLSNKELEGISDKYIKGLRLNEVPCNFRGSKEETIEYIKNYIQKLISKEK